MSNLYFLFIIILQVGGVSGQAGRGLRVPAATLGCGWVG
jgi:hypothetical protein